METISKKTKVAESTTQLSLLKEKVFKGHSVIDTLNDFEEMFLDCIASELAFDSEYRYRMIVARKCIRDVLLSVELDVVTNEPSLVITYSLE